jgi:hypothetical protein
VDDVPLEIQVFNKERCLLAFLIGSFFSFLWRSYLLPAHPDKVQALDDATITGRLRAVNDVQRLALRQRCF